MKLVAPLVSGPSTGRVVVLFPHAGGSPRFYRHLAEAMPHQRVLAVTYPGRDHLAHEAPLADLHDLADTVAGELRRELGPDPEAPLVLVGHSLGAFAAYETAVSLGGHGTPRRAVVVASGQTAPTRSQCRRWAETTGWTDSELVADVVRQNPGSAPVWENAELRAFFLPTVRADYRLLATYRPSGACVEEVRVVVGRDDAEVDHDGLADWQQFSDRHTEVSLLDGGHFYLERPDVQLNGVLQAVLAATDPTGGDDHA